MKGLGMVLVACALVAVSHRSWADGPHTNEVLRVVLELSDGSRLIGVPGIQSVPLQTAYAKMNVPLRAVLGMNMGADHETASFELENGDKLTGVLTLGPLSINHTWSIGACAGNNSPEKKAPFKGRIDEVMVFNRALSADEVKAVYDAQK